jgi:hypothetical protein
MLDIGYHLVPRDEPYRELGPTISIGATPKQRHIDSCGDGRHTTLEITTSNAPPIPPTPDVTEFSAFATTDRIQRVVPLLLGYPPVPSGTLRLRRFISVD